MDTQFRVSLAIGLLIYIILVSYIGYRNRNSSSSEDYFLASRTMPSWLLAITFIASWWGGGSAIDLVDQAHNEGISTFWIYGVPVLLSTFLMGLFAGGIRRIATISQSELIEKRYDKKVAFLLAILIVVFMTISSSVQVIVVGRLFESFLGLEYGLSATIGTLLVLFYSLFGGFRGVVLTDFLQFIFFLVSAIFLLILSYNMSGGFEAVELLSKTSDHNGYISFFHNLDKNIAYVITFGTSWMIQANVWQRISAASTPKSAKKMMVISFLVFVPLYFMVTLTGMFSGVIFDELPEGGVVPALLLGLESPIISGIIFIGLCSAIMSTMDSMFNAGALSITVDIYKRYIAPSSSKKSEVMAGRVATALIALVALFIGINIKSVLTISWIGADFIATGVFVPLVLGFLWNRGTSTAAFSSMIFGLLFSFYNLSVALGSGFPVAWEIASAKQAIVGIGCSFVIFVTVSLFTKPNFEKANSFIDITGVIKRRR